MKKRKKRNQGEIEYWQPTSDMLISLLLILLLVILLLGLYLKYRPNVYNINKGKGPAEATTEYDGHEDHREDHLYDNPISEDDGGGGAGDNKGNDEGDKPGKYPDKGVKSAVHVTLIDAETKLPVKEPGVTFELYNEKKALQTLNTYYPEFVTYHEFSTTKDGTFYLPEKIWPGSYSFHEITEAAGYDAADNKSFKVDRLYDWPKPLEVNIPVYPSRNTVRISLTDKDSGQGVTGGTFNVVAAENIVTADGTVRYKAGEVASVITLDEMGNGESEPVYLGKYVLKQQQIPEYYASVMEDVEAVVEKKTEQEPEAHRIKTEKTSITIQLTDELHPEETLAGVSYEINCDGQEAKTYNTDQNGSIQLVDVNKNVTYHIKQTAKTGDYLLDETVHDVPVDAEGRIKSEAQANVHLTNRMIRVTIGLTDLLLKTQVSDANLAINDENGKVIKTWTTTGTPVTLTDLKPGNYQVVRDGKELDSYLLTVKDTADEQVLNIEIFTWRSAAVIGIGIVVLIIVVAGLRIIIGGILKRRKKKIEAGRPTIEEDRSDNERGE